MSDDPDAASAVRPKRHVAHAIRSRADRLRTGAVNARQRFTPVDIAFNLWTRDVSIGGAVLSGAIAFRMFLWTLPAVLVGVGLLGFDSGDADAGANKLGLGQATAQSIEAAAQQAHRGRWLLVLTGLVALASVSKTLGTTLSAAIALTWKLSLHKLTKGYVRIAGITAGIALCSIVLVGVCAWLRNLSLALGLIGSLCAVVVWAAGWWGVSALLPHPSLPWWGLLPGAALFGVGAEIMHLAVLFYLSPRITSASALYGSLGLASTLLLGAYLLARLMIASAGFNALMYERYVVPDEPPRDDLA